MSPFFRILLGLFLALYLLTIVFIGVNADKVLAHGNDFQAQYGAAVLVRSGQNVYDLSAEAQIQEAATGRKTTVAEVVPFINSPLALPWLYPLGALPFSVAYMAWVGLLYLALLLLLWLMSTLFNELKKTAKLAQHRTSLDEKGFFLLAAIVMHWTVVGLFAGQFSILLGISLFATYVLLRKKRDVWAGGTLALLCIKPYLLVLPLLLLLYKRRWKAVAACVVAVMGVGVLAYLVAGPESFAAYSQLGNMLFWIGDEPMKIHLSRQVTARALAYVMLGGEVFTTHHAALWLGLLAGMAFVSRPFIKAGTAVSSSEWAVLCMGMVFSSVHMHSHDALILLFPLLAWYATSPQTLYKRMGALVGMILVLLPLLFYAGFLVSVSILFVMAYRYYVLRNSLT